MSEQKAFEVGGAEALAFGALTMAEKNDSLHRQTLGELSPSADANQALHLPAKFAEELHHYFSECIRVADQKAAFLFVACSALLGYLFDKFFEKDPNLKSPLSELATNDFVVIAVMIAALVALTFLARSGFFAIRVRPRFWKSQQWRKMWKQAVAVDFRRAIIRTAIACVFIAFTFVIEKGTVVQVQNYITHRTFFFVFFGVAVFFLVSAVWMATRVVTPRLWPSHAPHMFWEDVYKKFPLPEDAERYSAEAMRLMGTRDFLEEKLRNCHDLAHLSHDKYHDLNRAISLGRIGCIFTFLFLLLHFLGRTATLP
jgi:pycsar effector protein